MFPQISQQSELNPEKVQKCFTKNSTDARIYCVLSFLSCKLRTSTHFVIKISHNVEHHYSLLYVC